MSSTVTVLGASGNIGKLLVPYLSARGYQVRAVGRSRPSFDLPGVTNHRVAYSEQEALNQACAGTSAIYMLIGLEYKTNVWQQEWPPLTERLILAAQFSGSKLIFFDNVYGYGLVSGSINEETPLNPNTKKGAVRAKMDEMLLQAITSGQIRAVLAKAPDFYGPGITTSLPGDRFFDLLINKQTLEFFGNPEMIHNYAYVGDLAPALEKLANSDFIGNIHLPTGPTITGYQMAEILKTLAGNDLKVAPMRQSTAWWLGVFIPILRELHEMMYQSENPFNFSSIKIMKMFPDLKITSYEDGLAQTIKWYKNHIPAKNK